MDDNESIEHLIKMYPHDLQMYRDAPKGHISLAEFENLGAERLEGKLKRNLINFCKLIHMLFKLENNYETQSRINFFT